MWNAIANFLAMLNVWVAPFGAVWIIDGILRRWRFDPVGIHTVSSQSRTGAQGHAEGASGRAVDAPWTSRPEAVATRANGKSLISSTFLEAL